MKKNIKGSFKGGPNALWLLFLMISLGIVYLFWYNSINRDVEPISYSKLLTAIENNKVESIVIQGQHVQGKYKDGKMFDTYVMPSSKLWETLRSHNVEMDVYPVEKDSWGGYILLLALLLGIALFIIYLRQTQGGGGGGGGGKIFNVGKSKARFFSPNTITITFKDVAGNTEAKEDVKDIIEFLKSIDILFLNF